jgi:L-aspartate oxidase
LWGRTTNALGATGDGVWLAARAGAQLADLEFMQFHPTALDMGEGQRVLLTEALRGDGAILMDENGARFVDELAPRHVVAHAILERGRAFLDLRPIADVERRFPTVWAGLARYGVDPMVGPVPVAPAAHYFIGGVASDAHGRTSLPGLFAAGECAATGLHGANRMAGNSLLETVVVGRRVGVRALDEPEPADLSEVAGDHWWPTLDPSIPRTMWEHVGPIRDGDGIQKAIDALGRLEPSPHRDLCGMIARAAAARMESRGAHIRSDFPEPDEAFAARSFDHLPGRVTH